jgi:branched-chain amino acid transport system permease protein
VDGFVVDALGVLGSAAISALVAVGLAVSFRLMGVINLAHGALLAVGAYAGVELTAHTHAPWPVVLGGAAVVGAVAGLVIEVLVVRRVYADPEMSILATFGLALVITQAIAITVGKNYQSMPNPVAGASTIAGELYPTYRLVLIAVAAVVLAVIVALLYLTGFGLQVRAAALSTSLAELLGIRAGRVRTVVFAVSTGLAALAGALLAPISTITPDMGDDFLFSAFIVVIISGRKVVGVVPGALGVAVVSTVASRIWDENVARLAVLALAFAVLVWVDRPAVRGVV